jgi:hypothetical protein
MDSPKPLLDNIPKHPSRRKESASPSLLKPRPIATNSRVKLDEKFRKDMYLAFVNNALQQHANVRVVRSNQRWLFNRVFVQGNSEPFDELVNQFNFKRKSEEGPPVTAQLRLWILALSHTVSRLERHHSALVDAIANMPWTTMDNSFVQSYILFIGMLLSARTEYLSLILSKIVQGFTHRASQSILNLLVLMLCKNRIGSSSTRFRFPGNLVESNNPTCCLRPPPFPSSSLAIPNAHPAFHITASSCEELSPQAAEPSRTDHLHPQLVACERVLP